MRRALVAIFALTGCARGVSREGLANRSGSSKTLVEQADQAFADALELDYRAPFKPTREASRRRAAQLYFEACANGDKPSCWRALPISDTPTRELEKLRDNCIGGDLMSCRARQYQMSEFPSTDELGWAGRKWACAVVDPPSPDCDRVTLRHECSLGFAHSCEFLIELDTIEGPDRWAMTMQTEEAARVGCQVGLVFDCMVLEELYAFHGLLMFHDRRQGMADWQRTRERICQLSYYPRGSCDFEVVLYELKGQLTEARDVAEQMCQINGVGCIVLASRYLDGKYQEPVPHRGRDLLVFECAKPRAEIVLADRAICDRLMTTAARR